MPKSFLALCVTLALCWPTQADDSNPGPMTVPFELLPTKHIAVQLKVNGKGPYRVIFDTGAPIMLLNSRAAKESGVIGKGTAAPLFGMFGSVGQNQIKTLELGGLKAENVQTVVMDHPTVEIMSKYFGPIEGIVGFPFFARYKTTIDYQAKTLTFVPTGYQPPDTLKAMVATVMALAGDQPAKKVLAPAGSWGMILRKPASDEDAGVLVDEVMPGTPAAVAGLRTGDRLLSLDGRWTDTVADAYRAAGYVKPGTRATLIIKRGGQEIEFNVTPQAGI